MEELARKIMEAVEGGQSLVLSDPVWPAGWKRRMEKIASNPPAETGPPILIPTSGTTGMPKYCIHTAATLNCAANGFATRFGRRGIIHAVNILPLHHVGGLMPILRAGACSGQVHFADYRRADSLQSASFPLEQASLSLVPTQLRRMLANAAMKTTLRRFGLILAGGAACPADLLEQARQAGLNLCPCYGSTETAAMVTALDPEDFLAGESGVGAAMPHAKVTVGTGGQVKIESDSLCHGYLPADPGFIRSPFTTGDLGKMDSAGRLHIQGRADRVINTGGEKIHPEQVELAALSSGIVSAARCHGVSDTEWGQKVVLEVVLSDPSASPEQLRGILAGQLPPYAIPKEVHSRSHLAPTKTFDDTARGS